MENQIVQQVDQAKHDERPANQGETASLQEKLAADSRQDNSASTLKIGDSARTNSGVSQFLPSFDGLDNQLAIWQGSGQGSEQSDAKSAAGKAAASNADKTLESGWSARYAANFDRSENTADAAQHLDMAPILGLPQGASQEDLIKTVHAQEDELLKQLIS